MTASKVSERTVAGYRVSCGHMVPFGASQARTGVNFSVFSANGTGCTLASAIATGLAQGMTMIEAIARARDYVRIAIQTAPGFGKGHGPLNHAHTVEPFKGG